MADKSDKDKWQPWLSAINKILDYGKDWVPIILAFIAMVISIRNCNKKDEILAEQKEIEHYQILSKYQPKIKAAGNPICDSIIYTLDTLELEKRFQNIDKKNVKMKEVWVGNKKLFVVEGFSLPYNPYLHYKLKCTISGNSDAEIIYSSVFDDLSGEFFIKNNIDSSTNFSNKYGNNLPINRIMEKGDTLTFEFRHPILNYKNNKFQIHILIYYLNSLKNLYESYFWIKGELKKTPVIFNPREKKHLLPLKTKFDSSFVHFGKPRVITNYYNIHEQDSILNKIQTLK